ncbi:MAG TPA: metallophosphoesterase family protein [Polyangiaceae bacterium]|nr:metallophosphoesterase family protein [Polyangiaceae bacterium]
MARTFAIGDIHGDLDHLDRLLAKLPPLAADDTLVFLGDYVDRGPKSKEVVLRVREIEARRACKVVCLRGNHEDAWLQVLEAGWPEFIIPRGNGCLETLRSYGGGTVPGEDDPPTTEEMRSMFKGDFFPTDVVEWMKTLPFFYEDEHAIYVHAGLVHKLDEQSQGYFPAPADTSPKRALLWTRSREFFTEYRGKLVVVGHTSTELLPVELSSYTPADPTDLWAGPSVVAIDTRCGKGGFLTAVELPARLVYESR